MLICAALGIEQRLISCSTRVAGPCMHSAPPPPPSLPQGYVWDWFTFQAWPGATSRIHIAYFRGADPGQRRLGQHDVPAVPDAVRHLQPVAEELLPGHHPPALPAPRQPQGQHARRHPLLQDPDAALAHPGSPRHPHGGLRSAPQRASGGGSTACVACRQPSCFQLSLSP